MKINIIKHPAAAHLLTQLRDKTTPPAHFRGIAKQLTYFLVIEATRDLPIKRVAVETPIETHEGAMLRDALIAIPILRAGLSMLQPVVDLFEEVSVGYLGMERDETTAVAHTYYCKLPPLSQGHALILDPMLATGGSAARALSEVQKQKPKSITMVSVVAAPEGVKRLNEEFPDVAIFAAALDKNLNNQKYIVPGLGDFGDRLYGTA